MVEILVDSDASIDSSNGAVLMRATERSHAKVVRALLKHHLTADKQGPNGSTALDITCEHNQLEVVVKLVNRGDTFNVTDTDGYTPLITAPQLRFTDVAQFLPSRGAQINARLSRGLRDACQERIEREP
ncbi:hypothetical protein ON010_g5911 [Phytophthora cinnamomi]|nr:hypothetical protein ON010_g5911 [Phytophthora cinnamomi]